MWTYYGIPQLIFWSTYFVILIIMAALSGFPWLLIIVIMKFFLLFWFSSELLYIDIYITSLLFVVSDIMAFLLLAAYGFLLTFYGSFVLYLAIGSSYSLGARFIFLEDLHWSFIHIYT